MTSDQYFELVTACDDVLLAPGAPGDIAAVPWLHVIREHPVFLARYTAVFRPPGFWRDNGDRLRQLLAAERTRRRPHRAVRKVPDGPVDVLFVSHLLNRARLDAVDDFYFGSLPADVRAAGRSAIVALVDHTAEGIGGGRTTVTDDLVLSQRLDARDERAIAGRMREVAGYLGTSAARTSGLPARVRQVAGWFARGPEARTALRVAIQIERLIRHLQPRMVITTHEGHAWERLLFAAARRGHPPVRTAGYHATALFPLQHALTRPLKPEHNPDIILTAGRITRDALAARPGLRGRPIEVLGSNRRFDPGAFDRSILRPGCVVIPEGYPDECRILFRFAVAAARLAPDIRWFLRLHPQMSFADVQQDITAEGSVPANVILSTRTLAEDFEASSWALYRGSSAAIQAVAAGLRPIYVKADEPLSIDPLFDLKGWRTEVTLPEEALNVIAADRDTPPEALRDDRNMAARYAADYFQPLNAGVLLRALEGSSPA